MIPINFEEAYSKPLGAGNNPNTGDLPRCVAVDPNTPGVVMIVSCWEPSPAEWEIMKRDKKIYIGVMASPQAQTQPPICVIGANPFTALGDPWIRVDEKRQDYPSPHDPVVVKFVPKPVEKTESDCDSFDGMAKIECDPDYDTRS
jgi:hypothetical protein